MPSVSSGETCDGIAYLAWDQLGSGNKRLKTSPMVQCFGRFRKFTFPSEMEMLSSDVGKVSAKYVRSVGSTAVFFSTDKSGNRIALAQSIGPFDARGVEVGPVEENLVDWSIKLKNDGFEKVIVNPIKSLFERTILVTSRTFSMVQSALVPVGPFAKKLAQRIPQVATEAYDIARSIRIEIEVVEKREGGE